jgi:hypothetical protein
MTMDRAVQVTYSLLRWYVFARSAIQAGAA